MADTDAASHDLDRDLNIEWLPLKALSPFVRNARTHSKKQIRQIADSIRQFGFTNPVLIDDGNTILAGHGRVAAAKLLGLERLPCLRLSRLTATQKRAYVLADNKLALNAGWDEELLAEELQCPARHRRRFRYRHDWLFDCRGRHFDRGAASGRAGRSGRRSSAGS